MKLSGIAAKFAETSGKDLGFTVKSKETGLLLKVIGKTPGGGYIVVKMSGKNAGKESLIEDTERYVMAEDSVSKKAKRMESIKAELKVLGAKELEITNQVDALEVELEALEASAG